MSAHPAARLLLELGDTPDQIALSLLEQGVTGCPNDGFRCGLAERLRRAGYHVHVDDDVVEILDADGWAVDSFPTTDAQREFAQRFDRHDYPALVAPSLRTVEADEAVGVAL